jgi:CheY-like chemotaxis protein
VSTIDRLRQFFAKRRAESQTEKEGLAKTVVGQTEHWPAMRRTISPGVRVLLVDDSATIVIMLRKMLQPHKIETIEAADAESALRLVAEKKPDLIFLDIILPGMSGFEALRHLRRHRLTADIPVIMMSGNEQAAEQFYAQKIGADDFMKKPFSREEVLHRVERLLDAGGVPRRAGQPPAGIPEPAAVPNKVAVPAASPMTPAIIATAVLPGQPLAPAIPPVVAAPVAPAPRAPAAAEFMVDLDEPEAVETDTDAAWQFAQVGDPPRATPASAAEVRLATGPAPAERKAENPVDKPVDPAASLWMTQAGAFSGAGPFGGVSLSSVQIRIDFGDTPVAPAAPVKDKDDPDPRAG